MHRMKLHYGLILALCLSATGHAQKPKPAAPDQRRLIEFYEHELAESEKEHNWEAIARRLAPDFLEIAADGRVYNAQQVAEYFPQIQLHSFKLSEKEFRSLGPNAALVAYRSDVDASFKGQRLPGAFRISSVWVRRNGIWLLKFHQVTPVPKQ